MLDKLFDFIFKFPIIRKFRPLYDKNKSIVLYIFFGGLTTLVNILVYLLFARVLGEIAPLSYFIDWLENSFEITSEKSLPLVATAISWFISVLFAFITNRIWVFNAPTTNKKEFLKQISAFFGGRAFSGGLDMLIIFIFVSVLKFNDILVKILSNVLVLILNYIISKLFVFKKKS